MYLRKKNAKFANVFDRSYIKLRRVALTYNFTKLLSKQSPVKGLTATVFGNNLAVWKKVPFVDPDYTGDSNDGGANDPTARYIGMGDRKSTRLNSSHPNPSRMPSSA